MYTCAYFGLRIGPLHIAFDSAACMQLFQDAARSKSSQTWPEASKVIRGLGHTFWLGVLGFVLCCFCAGFVSSRLRWASVVGSNINN